MQRTLIMVRAIVLASCIAASVASGQDKEKVKRVPVMVVLASDLPYSGNVFILRRPDAIPADLILLREETARADLLSEAVRDLLDTRRIYGDVPIERVLLRSRPSQSATRRKLLPWAERVLNDVRSAPLQEFPDVGTARAVQIWLPRTKKGGD